MVRFMPSYSLQTIALVGVVVITALTLLNKRRRSIRGLRLPPGPVPLPIVGNLLSIDAKQPWVTYAKWAARFGDIITTRVLNQDMIVINSKKVAKDLLDQRSGIYSGRPHIATREACGWSFNFCWTAYGDEWRSHRRLFHQAFRAQAALAFRPVQLKMAHRLVSDILSSPHEFTKHIPRFSAAMIMSIVYDYEATPGCDHLVELFERGTPLAMECLTPEASALSFLLNLPEWFPGAVFTRKAALSKRCAIQMITESFEYARRRQAMGSSASAIALDLLRDTKSDDLPRLRMLRDVCGTAFVAGAETTASTLQCFMLAMLQHPEVQEQAQAEIDAVVGTDRLPNFDDRENLPYVEAILLETLRLYPVVPLGLPHAATDNDVYGNIFIPKESTVVTNIWAMHQNEDDYPEPGAFKPERFFVKGKLNGEKSVDSLAFGFGRRVCPGRYAADGSLWAAMVSILCAFKITKARDELGEEVEFEPNFTSGVTTAPEAFPCSITPRIDLGKLLAVHASQ